MRRNLPRVLPGDYLTADLLNVLYEEIARLELSVGANLNLSKGKGGMTLTATCPDRFWVEITGAVATIGGGKAYPWTERIPVSGGTWADSDRTGTTAVDGAGQPIGDPAIESNKNASVPLNTIVMAQRANGVLGFIYRACST